ncbi:MAG: hypothetical protein EOO02_18830 [Chitinophagaceae bacterium]|nr:MAG: hypothetical protein EOO02_18830 [Chitinophagaceae bacterium]
MLRQLGFRVQTKDIMLLENWKDESSSNRYFCRGMSKAALDDLPVNKLTPVKRMREFSERSGIKIAEEA